MLFDTYTSVDLQQFSTDTPLPLVVQEAGAPVFISVTLTLPPRNFPSVASSASAIYSLFVDGALCLDEGGSSFQGQTFGGNLLVGWWSGDSFSPCSLAIAEADWLVALNSDIRSSEYRYSYSKYRYSYSK